MKMHFNIVKEVGNRDGYLMAYLSLAGIYRGIGDLERSLQYCQESVKVAEEIGSKTMALDWRIVDLGATYLRRRDFELAKKYLKLHLNVAKELEDKMWRSMCILQSRFVF